MVVKLAVLIPSRRLVSPVWATELRRLKVPLDTEFILDQSMNIDTSRNLLVKKALEIGAERILFLDDDVVPENSNIVFDLMQLQDRLCKGAEKVNNIPEIGPIVSALYYAKYRQPLKQEIVSAPTASMVTPSGNVPVQIDGNRDYMECDIVGAGCMLAYSYVFRHINGPWFKFIQNTINGAPFELSEDSYFCMSCTKLLGIRPVVSTKIRCDHIASQSCIRGKDGKLVL